MTLQQQFESGVSHHQAGRLAEAERIYRQVLAQQPESCGRITSVGDVGRAGGPVGRGGGIDPPGDRDLFDQCLLYYSNLGNALADVGRLDEAIAACRQAIRLKPDLAEAHYNLGIALQGKGQLDEAIAAYRQAIGIKPDFAKAHYNLGSTLRRQAAA